ncbi:LOW QUALITY PROTEIN: putative deoxyribonuclease-2 [Crassostrea angulata]|uniref:LOW QUALITY PROTEIN: putative deoxyribonuclease-2 n=1 Tax=Magallana angulata TaxID=2784310 RepID=UPI0022B1B309|nr:LOW QUALITY PROTEIN: putative deoxyribonuclease-2 [Crassostrea angulata]
MTRKNFDIKISNPMNSVHIPIKTFGNVQLEILAKSASFGQDIYDKLISPKLADHLLVRTWRPKLSDTALVSNVINACFPNKIAFNHGIDHSKWAVTKKKHLICIGDINRQETQAKRGGLSLCLTNADASKEFRELDNRCAANNKRVPPKGICPNQKWAKISP